MKNMIIVVMNGMQCIYIDVINVERKFMSMEDMIGVKDEALD